MIYLLSPWNIGLAFSKTSLKSLLGFGLPYQFNSLLAVVKDRFVNIILWKIIGADGVGIIGWAQTWAQKPLRFLMDNVTRVTFPSFSRLQDHPDELKKGIERTLFFITLVTFPTLAGIALIAPEFVSIIPRYSKWEEGLAPLTMFCFAAAWACVSTPLTNTLNALGKVKINSYLMLMWTVLTWVLTPWLADRLGFIGVAYAAVIISFSSIVPIYYVKKLTGFSLVESVVKPLTATLAMIIAVLLISGVFNGIFGIVLEIVTGVVVFSGCIYLMVGKSLISDSQRLLYAFRKK
jgi:O-antigen/teichoic acid export membrane protein